MPSWMESMNKKLLDAVCPYNVKLFIVKLILNNEEVGCKERCRNKNADLNIQNY